MWFAPLRACAIDGNNVTLEAANEFSGVWLKDNYLSLLQDAFAVAAGRQTPGQIQNCHGKCAGSGRIRASSGQNQSP